jgi:hypothetical protein
MFDNREIPLHVDVPVRREILGGREVTVARVTDAPGAEALAPRGNVFRFGNTASLVAGSLFSSSAVSEADLVSRSVDQGVCNTGQDVALAGGVSQEDLVNLLADFRVSGRAERGYSLEDLAQPLEAGSRVIAFVNAGELWDTVYEPSLIGANSAVVMEGVARDARSQEICAFLMRDPARPEQEIFVDADKTMRAWLDAGGWQIVRN